MENKKIYSVTGIFDTPDGIIKAAKEVNKAGYKKYDVNTPYPVHGMDKAMKLKPSPLGYFALAFGLTGAFAAFAFMTWSMSMDYPLIISGKPFFPLPAFIPVTFEVTVLLASVGTVLSMLFFLFKFPNNSHPLQDTPYMKKVSADKYGVSIEAKDSKFDENEITEFLKKLGASEVETIYFDNETLNANFKIFDKKFVGFLIFTSIMVSGATYLVLNKLTYLPPFDWMMKQNRLDAQYPTKFFADGKSERDPVSGTVPREDMPYMYKGKPDEAGKALVNPIAPTEKNLAVGKKKFATYCSPCHGFRAEGDSRLNGQFPNPPSLHSEKVRNWTDGRIFAVLTEGQNIMPSYASQLNKEERWQVILYVRALQRAFNAKEGDVK